MSIWETNGHTHTHILMSVGVEFLLIKSQGIQGQFRSGRYININILDPLLLIINF